MAPRDSTSLRLNPKEKALIARAAETLGDDLGAFIRNAARARAEEVLADAAYRQYMQATVARAIKSLETEPLVDDAEVRRQFGLRRRK